MNIRQKALTTALGAMLVSGSALAEQTIGIQAPTTTATATAHVNVRVIVQKIVVLRVGAADATTSDVNFTVDLNPQHSPATGNSMAYTGGAVPPTLGTTVATTNPTSSAGALTVAAWTNVTGTTLTCSLGALAGATAFASGATASGVPGTDDIAVSNAAGGSNLQHPGTTLTACDGATTSSIPARTTMGGSFTYSTTFTAANLEAGTYGNVVTYTATTL